MKREQEHHFSEFKIECRSCGSTTNKFKVVTYGEDAVAVEVKCEHCGVLEDITVLS